MVIFFFSGNTKKFLYTGAKKEEQEEQWIFSPRKQQTSPRGTYLTYKKAYHNVTKKNLQL